MNNEYEYNGKKYILLGDNSDTLHACDRCAFFEDDGTCDKQAGNDCVGVYGGYFVQKDSNTVHTGEMLLPTDSKERKSIPITSGVLDYFPLAIAEVAKASYAGNQQHHEGSALHWDKSKSTDHSDCISRHLIDRGKVDSDGIKHSAKLAWRALALLQIELENEKD